MTEPHRGPRPRSGATGRNEPADDGFLALQPLEPEDAAARAERKRAQIQRAAVGPFLQNGYAGTGIDDIAAAARISKQTLYKHFAGKEELFLSIIHDTVGEVLDELFHRIDTHLDGTADLEEELHALASRYIRLIMRPELLALRRLVIGEAGRFPQIGDVWWRDGPARFTGELAPQLERLAHQGQLALDDPALAAAQFNWLVLSVPMNTAMFCPTREFSTEELDHHAAAGVRTFIAAYRSRHGRDSTPLL
jgi:TetR/AcrR family transcriptional regulator, mexJK operon transcriptional repressor